MRRSGQIIWLAALVALALALAACGRDEEEGDRPGWAAGDDGGQHGAGHEEDCDLGDPPADLVGDADTEHRCGAEQLDGDGPLRDVVADVIDVAGVDGDDGRFGRDDVPGERDGAVAGEVAAVGAGGDAPEPGEGAHDHHVEGDRHHHPAGVGQAPLRRAAQRLDQRAAGHRAGSS